MKILSEVKTRMGGEKNYMTGSHPAHFFSFCFAFERLDTTSHHIKKEHQNQDALLKCVIIWECLTIWPKTGPCRGVVLDDVFSTFCTKTHFPENQKS